MSSPVNKNTTKWELIKAEIFKVLSVTSFHGVAQYLEAISPIIRYSWLIFIVISACSCAFFIFTSLVSFHHFDVFTKIRLVDSIPMYLPAVTFCLARNSTYPFSSLLAYCTLGDSTSCGINDFEKLQIFDVDTFTDKICYQINGRRKSYLSAKSLFVSNKTGYLSGINVGFLIPQNDFLIYSVSDNSVIPVHREINRFLESGFMVNVIVNKLVDNKLPDPYNSCKYVPDYLYDSEKYRQINCFDRCMMNRISDLCMCSVKEQNTCRNSTGCIKSEYSRFDS